MMGNLYAALVEGGTSDEGARKAAEKVVDCQNQLGDIRSDLAMVKGLLGVVVTGVIALLTKAFFI